MSDWDKMNFDEFKRFVENSQNLNNTKKRVIERLLEEIR